MDRGFGIGMNIRKAVPGTIQTKPTTGEEK
jgi:hypothetical protein